MAKRTTLGFAEKLKIVSFLERHRAEYSGKPASFVVKEIWSVFELYISVSALKDLVKTANVGLDFQRSPQDGSGKKDWHSVAACLARSIQELHVTLGFNSREAENLKSIISRNHNDVDSDDDTSTAE